MIVAKFDLRYMWPTCDTGVIVLFIAYKTYYRLVFLLDGSMLATHLIPTSNQEYQITLYTHVECKGPAIDMQHYSKMVEIQIFIAISVDSA